LIAGFGTRPTLRLFGLTFGAILLLTAWLLRPAPAGPTTTLAATEQTRAAEATADPRRTFRGLWLIDALGTLAGLSAIGIASPVGTELIGISPAMAAASPCGHAGLRPDPGGQPADAGGRPG
jgi:OFA family oxalate/formate antiporter-like MFS transporter